MPFGAAPLDEQKRIARYLDNPCMAADQSASQLQDQMALLGEYRQSLITAAVTGQLDIESTT